MVCFSLVLLQIIIISCFNSVASVQGCYKQCTQLAITFLFITNNSLITACDIDCFCRPNILYHQQFQVEQLVRLNCGWIV